MNQNIIVRLAAQGVGAFRAEMAAAAASINQLAAQSSAAAAANQAAARKAGMAMAAVGVAAIAVAAVSAKAAADLETRMNNVATIWDKSAMSIQDAGQGIVEMSKQVPQSANLLAQGLYDIASAGFMGADAMKILNVSAIAASAGMSDTATSARVITGILNAYGMQSRDASHVSDVLFQTVKLGVVTFEQLAQTMGDFIGTAAAAHVSLEEASSAFAAMTLAGIQSAEAGTSLNRMMMALIQPSDALQAVMLKLGAATGQELMDKFGGLHGAIVAVDGAVNHQATSLALLFPEMRALRGVLALTSADGSTYARVQGQITDATVTQGAAQAALNEQSKGTSYQFGILKNTITATAIQFGQALLPVLKLIVGGVKLLADAFISLPGPLKLVLAGGAVLTGILVGMVGVFLLLSPAIAAATIAFGAFGGAAGIAAGAATAFGAAVDLALGPVGWIVGAITLAVGAFAIWSHSKQEAKRRTDELKSSLDAETGAITDETTAIITNKIHKDGLIEKSAALGVSVGDLATAMLGDKDATERVNVARREAVAAAQAHYDAVMKGASGMGVLTKEQYEAGRSLADLTQKSDDVGKKIGQTNKDLDAAKVKWGQDKQVKDAVTSSTGKLTQSNKDAAASSANAAQAALDYAEALKSVKKSIDDAFSPTTALQELTKDQGTATDATKAGITARYDAQKDANDKAFRSEKEMLDATSQARKDALDRDHQAVLRALTDRFQAEADALDLEQRAQKEAFDATVQARKDALDDTFRAERHALDQRLSLLNEEFDQQKKAVDKAYEARKSELEWLVKTTWGTQRQAAIDALAGLETEHDHQLAELDRSQTDQVNVIKDGQEDSERTRKEGLDSQTQVEKDALDDRLAMAKAHLKDRQDAETLADADRYAAQKVALDGELQQLQDHLDDKQKAIAKQLQDRQDAENTAADTRRTNAKAKQDVTLADLQTQLDTQNKEHQKKLDDLQAIYQRSGRTLTADMLTELAKLPPGITSQLASAGDPAFQKFMESFKASVTGTTQTTINEVFAPFSGDLQALLKQVGEFGGADMMASVARGLANNPQGAEQLRNILAGLMAPKEVSPGVFAVPKAGGGYYPIRMSANAEGHVAQVAPAGSWRLWAEPETGGEAYIPLGMSKRGRSTALLGQVASQFGYGLIPMANGGLWGGASSSGGTGHSGPMFDVELNLVVNGGGDPGSVAVAVRREVERAFDTLARQVAVRAWRN